MKSQMRMEFEERHGCEVCDDMDIQTSVAWDNWKEAWKAAVAAVEPVKFLLNGARLKLSFQPITCEECGHESDELKCEPLSQYIADLQGQWVVLVPAENDRQL